MNWKRIKLAMLAWKDRNRSSRIAFEIAHRTEVAALGAHDREVFLDWLGLESADVTQLKGTAGFQAMSQKEQDRLLVYVAGSTSVSDAAPGALNTLLHDPTAKLDQAATFNAFLRAQSGQGEGWVRAAAAGVCGVHGNYSDRHRTPPSILAATARSLLLNARS